MTKWVRESILGYEKSMLDHMKTRNSMTGVNADGGEVEDKTREGLIITCSNFTLILKACKILKGC